LKKKLARARVNEREKNDGSMKARNSKEQSMVKKKKSNCQGQLWKPEENGNWAQAQLIWTPKPTSKIDMYTIKAQSELGFPKNPKPN
jgi:hypothetical protein